MHRWQSTLWSQINFIGECSAIRQVSEIRALLAYVLLAACFWPCGQGYCTKSEAVFHALQGKALTANVKQVHTEYMAAVGKVQKVTYDVTDIEQPLFRQDFAEYQAVVSELEHRLGSIIFQVGHLGLYTNFCPLQPVSISSSFALMPQTR